MSHEYDVQVRLPNGRLIWVVISASSIADATDRAKAMYGGQVVLVTY